MCGVDLRTGQELLAHKTLAMALRYSHLSPDHQVDWVQRLHNPADAPHRAATTATATEFVDVAGGGLGEGVDLAGDSNGGAQNRTGDLGIMRPSL